MANPIADSRDDRRPVVAVFLAFLQLGLTSFGGPVAHLGYFREAFVTRRRWIDDAGYADLVGLCSFCRGRHRARSVMGIGMARAGLAGSFAAWLGFTLPSAFALALVGYGVLAFRESIPAGVLEGLKVVAIAVVAQAIWGMARTLCPDRARLALAALAAVAMLASPTKLAQIGVLLVGALAGLIFLRATAIERPTSLGVRVPRPVAIASLMLFAALLAGLPVLATGASAQWLQLVDGFYRAGALVFGGGHVVLPLLQAEVVPRGWMTDDIFVAGYGATQAVPGPLFTFAAFLGAAMTKLPNGWLGAVICLTSIFAPSFLLVVGVLPFWEALRQRVRVRRALLGVNAAVVGLLLAALYDPMITSAIRGPADVAMALAAFLVLTAWRVPPWLVVGLGALGGWAIDALSASL